MSIDTGIPAWVLASGDPCEVCDDPSYWLRAMGAVLEWRADEREGGGM